MPSTTSRLLIFVFFSIASIGCLYGQLNETYFNDPDPRIGTLQAHIKVNNHIIVAGSVFDNNPQEPAVIKLDTLGNVVWSTTEQDSSTQDATVRLIMNDDNYIYAYVRANRVPYFDELWKIDANNGNILWKKDLDESNFSSLNHLLNYSDTSFLIGYYEDNYTKSKYAFIDKRDGTSISTHEIGSFSNGAIAIDQNKDIYLSKNDSLLKASSNNPDSIIWRTRYRYIDKNRFINIHFDSTNKMFLQAALDYSNRPYIAEVNTTTGDPIWETYPTNIDDAFSLAFVDQGRYIYSTWQHHISNWPYEGEFRTAKLDKETGEVIWLSTHHYTGTEINSNEGAVSIDVDDGGDVYLSGYHSKQNYDQSNWAVLKLSGNTGELLFENTITNDPSESDHTSSGKGVYVINDQPYFLGELEIFFQEPHDYNKISIVKADKQTGEVVFEKTVRGTFRFPSKVIQMERLPNNYTAVLLQLGLRTTLQVYDENLNLINEHGLLRDATLYGLYMKIENNLIHVVAQSSIHTIIDPAGYGQIERNGLFLFDLDGNLLDEQYHRGSYSISSDIIPELFVNPNGDRFLVFEEFDRIVCHKYDINGTHTWKEYNNIRNFQGINLHLIDYTDDSLVLFMDYRIYVINKVTLEADRLIINYPLPFGIRNIQQASHYQNDNVLICGGNPNGRYLTNFSFSTLDTTWRIDYDSEDDMKQFIFNEDSTVVYLMGSSSGDAVVRKVSLHDGSDEWVYRFKSQKGTATIPNKMILQQDQLILTGYSETPYGQELFIHTLSITGESIATYFKAPAQQDGHNQGTTITINANNSIWVGGEYHQPQDGPLGLILELTDDNIHNTISGYTFFDENRNGLKDSTERNLNFIKTILEPNGLGLYTDENGQFTYTLSTGIYQLSYEVLPDWELTTDSTSYTLDLGMGTVLSNINFGFAPREVKEKLDVSISSGFTRCNQSVRFYVDAINSGTTKIDSGILWLEIDELIQDIQPTTTADITESTHVLGWKFYDLYPQEIFRRELYLVMPGVIDGIEIGDSVTFHAYTIAEDTSNFEYSSLIRCSFDPNDKLVNPARDGTQNLTLFDEPLTYTVRFQNTGNDTAFIVTVKDTLDEHLSLSSFQLLGSSHLDIMKTDLTDGILTFTFEDIQLPDSTTDYHGSQGFISYRIMANSDLEEGQEIRNKAGIYFDQNPPVITNTTLNTMVSELPKLTALPNETIKIDDFVLFPNPSKGAISIRLNTKSNYQKLELRIYSLEGSLIQTEFITKSSTGLYKKQLNLPYSKGLYIFKVYVNDTTIVKKVIIE